MALLSVEEALARIVDGVAPTAAEPVALADAAGRVLAAPLAATLTQPPFDASAMDGYAVRGADVATLPARLSCIGEAAAGHPFAGNVGGGTCVRIFTGAPVPAGADAIVIQENTARDGDAVVVRDGAPDPAHIRRKGGDFALGDVLLGAGRRLTARDLTLAAAMGHGTLAVRRKPVVAILATGDELVAPGVAPGPGQIVSSNPYGVAALAAQAGAAPRLLGIARDTRAALAEKIAQARDADVLVTIGGASVGDHDLVAPALEAAGTKIAFWKIAMRPGKPMMFGTNGAQRALGLPGNPVSSLICARVFLVPLIERLIAAEARVQQLARATLATAIPGNGPRQHYMRARLTAVPGGGLSVSPVPDQDSSLMAPLAAADALIVRPPGAAALAAGAPVDVLLMDF